MLCRIADLIAEVPEAGGLAPRCQGYTCQEAGEPDVVIRESEYDFTKYPVDWPVENVAYMESSRLFYRALLEHEGFYLHASAVCVEGRAYLFSGPSGMGKSTHTRLWQQIFGEAAQVINDDKPALRCVDGIWYAYGTPWCGKDGININRKVPLAGVCFLKQAPHNKISRLSMQDAAANIISQTIRYFRSVERLDLMLGHVDKLIRNIPVFELENRPEPEAAYMSYETMLSAAKEIGL